MLHAEDHNVRVDTGSGQPGSHSLLAHIIILYGLCPFTKCEPNVNIPTINTPAMPFLNVSFVVQVSIYDALIVIHKVGNMLRKIRRKITSIGTILTLVRLSISDEQVDF